MRIPRKLKKKCKRLVRQKYGRVNCKVIEVRKSLRDFFVKIDPPITP